jgi:hypothetical protein
LGPEPAREHGTHAAPGRENDFALWGVNGGDAASQGEPATRPNTDNGSRFHLNLFAAGRPQFFLNASN